MKQGEGGGRRDEARGGGEGGGRKGKGGGKEGIATVT